MRTVTKITVYWDAQDSSNEGWAYRLSDPDGDIESGSLDASSDDLDVAIDETISISGLKLTPDMFAKEPQLDGGYAIWEDADQNAIEKSNEPLALYRVAVSGSDWTKVHWVRAKSSQKATQYVRSTDPKYYNDHSPWISVSIQDDSPGVVFFE